MPVIHALAIAAVAVVATGLLVSAIQPLDKTTIVLGALFACFLAALLVLANPNKADAHEWYPFECCSDNDCAQIPRAWIIEAPTGYVVSVPPGGHPMWPADKAEHFAASIPYRTARPSPDGAWHLCINGRGDVLCFFAVVGGV